MCNMCNYMCSMRNINQQKQILCKGYRAAYTYNTFQVKNCMRCLHDIKLFSSCGFLSRCPSIYCSYMTPWFKVLDSVQRTLKFVPCTGPCRRDFSSVCHIIHICCKNKCINQKGLLLYRRQPKFTSDVLRFIPVNTNKTFKFCKAVRQQIREEEVMDLFIPSFSASHF